MKLTLRTTFLSGAKNYHNLQENLLYFLVLKIKPKMRDVLGKMRECGKYVKMRDFPHDCGMVDTYDIHTYIHACMHACTVFCPGLKKGMVLLEEKGHFCSRNYILRAFSRT